MSLSDKQLHLLTAFLEADADNANGVDPTRFKLQHEDNIQEIEELESLQLLQRTNQGKYQITFSTLIALIGRTPIADRIVADCRKSFDALKAAFRSNPEKDIPLEELAQITSIPLPRLYVALPYLLLMPIWSSRSTELRAPNNHVRASVDILKYKTFDDLMALALRWGEHALQSTRPSTFQSSDSTTAADILDGLLGDQQSVPYSPPSIQESLRKFRKDYDGRTKTAFVMMQFGVTPAHSRIFEAIRSALSKHQIVALRADSKQYHDDLFSNVLTYVYGCNFGIAVFERIEQEAFNPNVSLEVGYMLGLNKAVCLLKDRTLKTLHTDLVGKLYRQFDPQDPTGTIPRELDAWLKDKEL